MTHPIMLQVADFKRISIILTLLVGDQKYTQGYTGLIKKSNNQIFLVTLLNPAKESSALNFPQIV